MSPLRQCLTSARRIVVKVGSRLLATDENLIARIAAEMGELGTKQFLIVSSGAVSLGCQKLGYARRPKQIPKLQAAASAGQSELMRRYADAMAAHGLTVAQVLLTYSDLASRRRLTNAQQALAALFEAGAIPIVNENDTVSTDEIGFGDNDQLASMVVPLVRAEALILLTDVDGVLDPSGKRIAIMDREATVGHLPHTNTHGTGGMPKKIEAALKASRFGATVVIANARQPRVLASTLAGEDVGTLFPPHGQLLRARQHWIAYTLRPRGAILVNDGAVHALTHDGGSLLPVGVIGMRGQFSRGDAVQVLTLDGREVARGLTKMGVLEVARVAGKGSRELVTQVGEADTVVIHRDDLVLVR